jgi:hypothetical protein
MAFSEVLATPDKHYLSSAKEKIVNESQKVPIIGSFCANNQDNLARACKDAVKCRKI